MHNIGLIGKARSGKDTAALWLVRNRHYTRLAFADPLKEMALRVNPIVDCSMWVYPQEIKVDRLADIVEDEGWEVAKDAHPEVRRLLQQMGQTIREHDEEFWIKAMRRKLNNAEAWNLPVVVTDVRYPNEAAMLRARGFKLVRILRPEPALSGPESAHSSETALDDYAADVTISNDAGIDSLYTQVSNL